MDKVMMQEAELPTFSTKAETLIFLAKSLQSAKVLPVFFFTVKEWESNKKGVLTKFKSLDWSEAKLVVRSSALCEDTLKSSLAGCFTSVIGVTQQTLIESIERVILSYHSNESGNQVLIQPLLEQVGVSGVAFGQDPNSSEHYYVINYDDQSGETDSITSGKCASGKHYIWHKQATWMPTGFLAKVIVMLQELEKIYQTSLLDVEFATACEELYLFQVRPLILLDREKQAFDHKKILERIEYKVSLGCKPHPYLFGSSTVYGVMPDWNPAEIVGIRPRPLALSLYRCLVTDSIWAYQRDNYGYNNLRSFPLLIDFEGLPYVDVRVSFNSFLPKELPQELADRLVNYYYSRLINTPALHDKVEFEIVFSCYTLDLQTRLGVLHDYGFSELDRKIIFDSLTKLTNTIIHNDSGIWKKDLEKISELERRQKQLFNCSLDPISKMYWILEDCKRYGTLPFAGLARAGFIAVQLLKSFVSENIINQEEYGRFFSSLNTVSSQISDSFYRDNKEDFLEKYGHLRPGTYDILSLRYDEALDTYFDWENRNNKHTEKQQPFSLSITQLRLIQEKIDHDGLQINVLELLEFIKAAIESREYSKFVFTRSMSEFLRLLSNFAETYGFSRDDCSYLDSKIIDALYVTSSDPYELMKNSILLGKTRYAVSKSISLPPLICKPEDVWAFHHLESMPNYITQRIATGPVVTVDQSKKYFDGAILLILNADPGFDWIFSHNIAGFVTQYGGANSHMAIRAGELGIPAVIGAGEARFQQWMKARKLCIDAMNKQVQVL